MVGREARVTNEFWDAIRAGEVDKVRELLARDRSLVNAKTEAGFSAVIVAKVRGQEAVLREILAAEPSLDIHDAAYIGDVRAARRILEADPSQLEAFSGDGFTALDLASYFGHRDLVAFLLERGARAEHEIRNENLFTALTGAVAEGHREIAKMLLDHGANANHRYAGGASPLITASFNGDPEMVKLLLAHGARADVVNDAGRTPANVAADRGHGDIVTMLRARGSGVVADREDPIRVSPESYDVSQENDRVRVLVESLPPGGSVGRHRHPDHVLVAITGGRIAVTSIHGRVETYDLEPGDAMWFPALTHEVENVGAGIWRATVVEFKPAEGRD
jgi:quercetin dioxygenase-like cupin family protein